jgi:precorrin-6A synthase
MCGRVIQSSAPVRLAIVEGMDARDSRVAMERCAEPGLAGDPAQSSHRRGVTRVAFEYEVIPGISSIQALAARHKIALNRIGQSIHITTGRKIAEGLPNNIDDVVVMLDADCAFKHVSEAATEIYWGAYLGTEDEILVSGNLRELADDIERMRKEAKARRGWIMDTYLLRRIGGH